MSRGLGRLEPGVDLPIDDPQGLLIANDCDPPTPGPSELWASPASFPEALLVAGAYVGRSISAAVEGNPCLAIEGGDSSEATQSTCGCLAINFVQHPAILSTDGCLKASKLNGDQPSADG